MLRLCDFPGCFPRIRTHFNQTPNINGTTSTTCWKNEETPNKSTERGLFSPDKLGSHGFDPQPRDFIDSRFFAIRFWNDSLSLPKRFLIHQSERIESFRSVWHIAGQPIRLQSSESKKIAWISSFVVTWLILLVCFSRSFDFFLIFFFQISLLAVLLLLDFFSFLKGWKA